MKLHTRLCDGDTSLLLSQIGLDLANELSIAELKQQRTDGEKREQVWADKRRHLFLKAPIGRSQASNATLFALTDANTLALY